jgi:ATP-dependent DNA ligase
MAASQIRARFIEPMLLLRTDNLPEGANLQYEVKLDGYRSIAFKSGAKSTSGPGTTKTSIIGITRS